MKKNIEYRIVRRFSGFFSEWYYDLQKKEYYWFFGTRYFWSHFAGNALTRSIPDEWRSVNIIEEITEEI